MPFLTACSRRVPAHTSLLSKLGLFALLIAGTIWAMPVWATVTISGAATTCDGAPPNFSGADCVVSVTDIEAELANGAVSVTSTSGDIVVSEAIAWSANTLTLAANQNISINAVMSATGTGGITLTYADTLTMQRDDPTDSFTGKINVAAASVVTIKGDIYTVLSASNIANADALDNLQAVTGNDTTVNYVLGKDIDASATSTWNVGDHDANAGTADEAMGFLPIGTGNFKGFKGNFNGLGHTIDSLYINRPSEQTIGLFNNTINTVEAPKIIQNMGLTNVDMSASSFVGGITSRAEHTTFYNAFTTGSVDLHGTLGYGGGLVRQLGNGTTNGAHIKNSYSKVNITGSITDNKFLGGLSGTLLQGSTITDSYAIGAVTGFSQIGGLVGTLSSCTVKNSYATGEVRGHGEQIGGLIGLAQGLALTSSYATGNVTNIISTGTSGATGGLIGFHNSVTGFDDLVKDSYATGNVTFTNNTGASSIFFNVGGLIGETNSVRVETSYSTGTVTGTDANSAGGFIGLNNQTVVEDSYSRSNVILGGTVVRAGGFIGDNQNTAPVHRSYSTGSVAPNTTDFHNAFIGRRVDPTPLSVNSFWDVDTSAIGASGDLNHGATGKTTAEMKTVATFTGATWDFVGETDNGTADIWNIDDSLNDGYPCLTEGIKISV